MSQPTAINLVPLRGLAGFSADSEKYDIGQGVQLIRKPPLNLDDHVEKHIDKLDLEDLQRCEWALQHTYPCDPEVHLGPKEKESDKFMKLALLAMWTTRPTGAYCTHYFKYHPRISMDKASTLNVVRDHFIPHPSYLSTFFEGGELSDLQTIFTNFQSSLEKNIRPWRALEFLFTALHIKYWGPRYVTFTSVLECLFSIESIEITHKLSERVALFLGESPEKRQTLFRKVKDIYRLRSNIVHGGNLSRNQEAEADTIAGELEQIVHRVLRLLFVDANLLDMFSKKEEHLEKYFEDLIFNS